LINQFLDSKTNLHDDPYGGSPENRLCFFKEVLEAVLEVWAPEADGCPYFTEGHAGLVPFGQPFIPNPDLPERFKNNWPFNPAEDMSIWYTLGAQGYTDNEPFKGSPKNEVSELCKPIYEALLGALKAKMS